jgi:transposase
MEWSAPPSRRIVTLSTEAIMSDQQIHIIGIDLGKNWFHLVAMDERGKPVYRKKLNRNQLGELIATLPQCVVAMESCPGSQFWGRRFADAGNTVRIIPAQRQAISKIEQERLQ